MAYRNLLKLNSEGSSSTAMAAEQQPFESDYEYAYRLQVMEAMTASLSLQPPSSTQNHSVSGSSDHPKTVKVGKTIRDPAKYDRWFAGEVPDYYNREPSRLYGEGDGVSGSSDHLKPPMVGKANRDQWAKYDRWFGGEVPDYDQESSRWYGEGSSVNVDEPEIFQVYFKGLIAFDGNCPSKPRILGIGVALCDSKGELMYKKSKQVKVGDGEWMNNEVAAGMALMEALKAAVDGGLTRVLFCCDYSPLYKHVTRQWRPGRFAALLRQIQSLQKRFIYCKASYVARKDVRYAFGLAREALASQSSDGAAESSTGTGVESCAICLEDVSIDHIFTIAGCMHRYCFSCMKQHVEVQLLNAVLPYCPHEGCNSALQVDSCQKFLTPKLIDIMSQRLAEAAIPVAEKIYCPYPRCSALMSSSRVIEHSIDAISRGKFSGIRKCIKCHQLFCVVCMAPWHKNMTCRAYQKTNLDQHGEEEKLKALAVNNQWRQCVKCSHMIELAKGCNHMTCRCGYEFCYTCGSKWKNCACPLWDINNIVDDDDDSSDEEIFDRNYDPRYYNNDSDDDYYWGP